MFDYHQILYQRARREEKRDEVLAIIMIIFLVIFGTINF
jgi:hypothetical protein